MKGGQQMKKCPKCGRELPEEMFNKNKNKKDGLSCYCKDCQREAHKKAKEKKISQDNKVSDIIPFGMKRCTKCKAIKPLEDFYVNSMGADGYFWHCKECCDSEHYSKPKYENSSISILLEPVPSDMKRCSKCGKIQPLENFGKNKNATDGLNYQCKSCLKEYRIQHKEERKIYDKKYCAEHKEEIAAYDRQYYQKNKEKLLAYQQQYLKTEKGKAVAKAHSHKRNAQKQNNGGEFTADEWLMLCSEFDNKCAYCGAETKLTADHIYPLSKGGVNKISNIIPVCQSCNSSKHAHTLKDWYPKQPFFSQERYDKIIDYILRNSFEER